MTQTSKNLMAFSERVQAEKQRTKDAIRDADELKQKEVSDINYCMLPGLLVPCKL